MSDEHLAASLLNFQSKEANPRLQPDPYHLQDFANQLSTDFVGFETALATRLKAALVEGFTHLDALPRSDPFWHNTNGRPTLGKLDDFAKYVRAANPREAWPHWLLAACDLMYCNNSFGAEGWRGLHACGALDVIWPVQAAWGVWTLSGVDTAASLRELLDAIGRRAEATERIKEEANQEMKNWVRAALGS